MKNQRGNILMIVVIVLAVSSATILLVPKIANEMTNSYRRLTIETAWKVTGENLRLAMRNPGWIRCKQLAACELRKVDPAQPNGPTYFENHVRQVLARLEQRLGCQPGVPDSCAAKIDVAAKLNIPAGGKAVPYVSMTVNFTDPTVTLAPLELHVDIPRGVSLGEKFLCNGFFMGYKANGDPICKNITSERKAVGEYVTKFVPAEMENSAKLGEDSVPDYVKDCAGAGESKFLLSYKWEHGKFYKHECGNRLPPWVVQ